MFLAIDCRIRGSFWVVPISAAGRLVGLRHAGSGRPAPLRTGCRGAGAAAARSLGRRGCGGLGRFRGGHHVLAADAPADPGALDRRQVDAAVGGELADHRRDVGALRDRGGRDGLRAGFAPEPSVRRHSALASGRAARRPGQVRRRPAAPVRVLPAPVRPSAPGRRAGGSTRVTDHPQLGADLDGLVLADADLQQGAGDRGGISVSTLSVDTSTSGSSSATSSPTALSQRVTVPSVTDSPISGSVTDVPDPLDPPVPAVGFSAGASVSGRRGLGRRRPARPAPPPARVPARARPRRPGAVRRCRRKPPRRCRTNRSRRR